MACWALLTTAPNTENSVARRLKDAQIEFLLIKQRIVRIMRGRKTEIFKAAFPRYIFVLVHDAWDAIRNITGVIDWVRIGTQPAIIPDEIIKQLRARVDSDGALPSTKESKFKFGERVIVRGNGVVTGYQAIYQFTDSHGRACVLQEWMGRYCIVGVPEVDIEKMSSKIFHRRQRFNRRKLRRRRFVTS